MSEGAAVSAARRWSASTNPCAVQRQIQRLRETRPKEGRRLAVKTPEDNRDGYV
jgi:hypothetical protein